MWWEKSSEIVKKIENRNESFVTQTLFKKKTTLISTDKNIKNPFFLHNFVYNDIFWNSCYKNCNSLDPPDWY